MKPHTSVVEQRMQLRQQQCAAAQFDQIDAGQAHVLLKTYSRLLWRRPRLFFSRPVTAAALTTLLRTGIKRDVVSD